jgi:opacity protein-like surface antigen
MIRKSLLAALLCLPTGALAQGTSILEGWDTGSVTIYGWLPGITGEQERRDGAPLVDLESADILDALDFAFFAAGEIRRDRVGLLFDIEYADLSQDGRAKRTFVDGADPASARVGTTLLMATGAVAYRLYEQDRVVADVYGGLRAFDVEADFSLRVPALDRRRSVSAEANWVDGLVGLRARAGFGERFGVSGTADVGGGIIGQSESTWQVTGTLDYAFTPRWEARLGYRYMSIDYESSDLSLDLDVYGPVAGITFRF